MREHENMIVALLLPIVIRRYWKGPWIIRWSELTAVTVRAMDI